MMSRILSSFSQPDAGLDAGTAVADLHPFLPSLAAEAAALQIEVLRHHGDGLQQVRHIAREHDGREDAAGELAVLDLPGHVHHALDAPVLGVLHAARRIVQQKAVLHGGDHVLEGVLSRLKIGVRHAGVGLAREALPAAVARGLGAKMHGALGVADAPLQDALLDDDGIVGEDPLVVEEVGARVPLDGGAVVHGDEGRRHVLADELFGLGPILHEHVHLHPVAEGLVDDHARDGGGAHALIFPWDHALAVHELQGALHRVGELPLQNVQHLGPAQVGSAVVITHDIVLLGAHHLQKTVAPQKVLFKVPIWGQKQLVDLLVFKAHDTVDDPLVPGLSVVSNGHQIGQDGLVPLLIRMDNVFAALEEHGRFVGDLVVFAEGQPPGQIPGKGHEPLFYLRLDGGDGVFVDVGEGIFPVGPAVVDLQHEAAAGEQLVLQNVDAGVAHPILLAPGIGRQYGRIAVFLFEMSDELLQQGLRALQKRAALYLHSFTSHSVFCIIPSRSIHFNTHPFVYAKSRHERIATKR